MKTESELVKNFSYLYSNGSKYEGVINQFSSIIKQNHEILMKEISSLKDYLRR